jgi:hypothetical protein
MQYLIYAAIGILANALSSLVGRALLALGFSYFTYTGLNVGVDWIQTQMQSYLSGMPGDILSFLGYLYIDKALSMIFSAFAAALVIRGAAGSVTRLQVKK